MDGLLVASLAAAPAVPGQAPSADTITVTASFAADQWISAEAPVSIVLSRRLTPADGSLAVVIGHTDVTALLELRDTIATYRPRTHRHAAGEGTVSVYLVRGSQWQQVGTFPIKVLTSLGLTAASMDPGFTLGSKGQLAEGGSADLDPGRGAYQDFTLNTGLQTAHAGTTWTLRNQLNLVGASRREEALRFSTLQARAPRLDLADYLVEYRRGENSVSLGHVTFGGSRHLVNGFGSRGVAGSLRGGAITLSGAAMNGTSVVGWDQPLGAGNDDHLIAAASLGIEVLPQRPGSLRLDATVLDGALLPQTSFTEAAVVDAERSSGGAFQVTASLSPRVRATAGFSRSRFLNPERDPELTAAGAVVRRPDSRNARFGELDLGLLQNVRLLVPVTLSAGLRHERVDPLYRSVGAWTQSDRLLEGVTVSGTLGVLAVQASADRSRDNLDDVPSVLTTRTRTSQGQLALPLAVVAGVSRLAPFWPTLTYGVLSTLQEGGGIPVDGEFSAGHVPDQKTTTRSGAAQWQSGRWQVQYRMSHTNQDNRQPGRELADFVAFSSALAIGFAASSRVSVSMDAGRDRQTNREFGQHTRVSRVGLTGTFQPWERTSVMASASLSRNRDEPRTATSSQAQGLLELSRSVSLGPSVNGQPRTSAQLYLRLSRQALESWQFLPDLASSLTSQASWQLSSGLTMRLF